jgi:hypothetical protein
MEKTHKPSASASCRRRQPASEQGPLQRIQIRGRQLRERGPDPGWVRRRTRRRSSPRAPSHRPPVQAPPPSTSAAASSGRCRDSRRPALAPAPTSLRAPRAACRSGSSATRRSCRKLCRHDAEPGNEKPASPSVSRARARAEVLPPAGCVIPPGLGDGVDDPIRIALLAHRLVHLDQAEPHETLERLVEARARAHVDDGSSPVPPTRKPAGDSGVLFVELRTRQRESHWSDLRTGQ